VPGNGIGWRARSRLGRRAALGALLASALAACGGGVAVRHPGPDAGPVVVTAGGAVRGTADGRMAEEFLGIPYAGPPVGSQRWRPPQPAARWEGVRAATRFARHCPQGSASAFGVASMSEDCLYLNVFAPAGHQRGASLPVLVWIHGGSLASGESDDYNPAGLAGDGVIAVTINYRLGALGFLAHPALAARPGGPSGDYGLMDQQAALRWVQRNITAFGGDPRKVTIFGQSAGGLSVLAQLASAPARGLFSAAIVESGTYQLTQQSLARAEAAGQVFAADAGCPGQTAACLRGLPVSAILHVQDSAYFPDIDGQVLTRPLPAAFASGQFSRVPVINGSNHDEGRLDIAESEIGGSPVTAANYRDMIAATAGVPAAAAAVIAARYPLTAYSSPSAALGAVSTDPAGACSALTADQWLSKYVPVYAYEFSDEHAPERFLPPVSFPYGAAHASEIQYLLSLPAAPFPGVLSPAQQQLAATMKQYWANFARHRSPATAAEPPWPRFDGASHQVLSLVPPRPRVETSLAAEHHCAFWATFRPAVAKR
jgi:para-nitrobenzyl esterase